MWLLSRYAHFQVFCYLMSQVLSGLEYCFVYLDDIGIYSASWTKHLQDLEAVFNHLKEANLKIKFSKCQFSKKHLHYVGHLVSKQSIQLFLEKESAIKS